MEIEMVVWTAGRKGIAFENCRMFQPFAFAD
jgi:hypothetical protein